MEDHDIASMRVDNLEYEESLRTTRGRLGDMFARLTHVSVSPTVIKLAMVKLKEPPFDTVQIE